MSGHCIQPQGMCRCIGRAIGPSCNFWSEPDYLKGRTKTSAAPVPPLFVNINKTHDYPACAIFRGGNCTCD